MTEAIKILTLIDMIFVILLAISGSIGGLLGEIMYCCVVFTIPLLIGFYTSLRLRAKREEEAGVAEAYNSRFTLDADRVKKLLPLIVPCVTVVFLVSLLTSLVLSALGSAPSVVEDKGIVPMLLEHALVPAVFEEMVFRYIPLILIAPYSKRVCVFYSAFCFALIHCSFAQMPYAFIAGVIFMVIDLSLDSVWPSIILHFVNNAASVLMMKYCTTTRSSWIFILALSSLCLVSLIFIYRKRREYLGIFSASLEKGQRGEYTYASAMLIAICGYFAIMNLLG